MDDFSYHTNILVTCNYIFNVASTLCGALTVLFILGAMAIDRRAMDRLSIRFTLVIAALDAVKALTILFYTEFHEDGPACTFIALFIHWQTLLYLFLNVCISLNLQLVFIHGLVLGKAFEVVMWVSAFFMSTLLMLIGLATGKYGMDQETKQCEIRDPFSPHSLVVVWTTFLFWALLACAYCFVVVVWTIFNLIRKISTLAAVPAGVGRRRRQQVMDANAKIQQKIRQLIWRMYISSSTLLTCIPGILNFLALLIDPAFKDAMKTVVAKASANNYLPEKDTSNSAIPKDFDYGSQHELTDVEKQPPSIEPAADKAMPQESIPPFQDPWEDEFAGESPTAFIDEDRISEITLYAYTRRL